MNRKGRLDIPSSRSDVDVVYKTPKMICASRECLKIHAEKFAKRASRPALAASALSVLLSVLPIVTTDQKFTDCWFISGESLPGIYLGIAWLSGGAFVYFLAITLLNVKRLSSNYMIEELLKDEGATETER